MLSLEEQIERIADSATRALEVEPVLAGGLDPRRRWRTVAMSAVLVAAAAVALIAMVSSKATEKRTVSPSPTSGSSPAEPTIASTIPETATTITSPVRPTVWWSDLGELPTDLASLPLPPEGTISLQAVDGRPIIVRRTSDQLCVLEGPTGGGGCTELSTGQTEISLQHGGSSGTSANGAVLPRFSYWLTSDAVTVSFVDIHGVSACNEGPQPILAYPGVTLWTCISDGSTPRGQTRSIYRVNDVDYLAGLD